MSLDDLRWMLGMLIGGASIVLSWVCFLQLDEPGQLRRHLRHMGIVWSRASQPGVEGSRLVALVLFKVPCAFSHGPQRITCLLEAPTLLNGQETTLAMICWARLV